MIFKTHPANIKQIKAHIKAYGPTYFHGDGNFYKASDQLHSDNNQTYSNPSQEEAKYRVKFNDVSEVPDTVEELNEMLLKAKNNEIMAQRKPGATNTVATFHVEEEGSPAGDSAAAVDTRLADKDSEIEDLKKQLAAATKKKETKVKKATGPEGETDTNEGESGSSESDSGEGDEQA